MPCCGRCLGNDQDVEAPLLDVCLLEACEKSLKVSVCLPRSRILRGSWWPFRSSGDEIELRLAVLGGPDCDIFGPKKETAWCRWGGRVVHEVQGLLPDTRYTVQVSLLIEGQQSSEEALLQSLEARTAPASTCQFAGEDWGRSAFGKEGKDPKKDVAVPSRSPKSAGGRSVGPSISAQPAAPPRSVSDADESTIAPSELDGRDLEDRPEEWDFGVEEVHPNQSKIRDVSEAVNIEEVVPTTGQSIQCNLCSLMDCFKLARPQPTVTEESTEVTFHASSGSQGDVVHADTARRRRPVRPRFPGVAVDPASVGLELLPALNESQLQLVLDGRSRRARDAETPAARDS